ncbi:hypothetical protein CDL12_08408 [Handroanthus impetiginosus]|uniref:Uncharacterized protein n=1 Tax=Handroanthus impetiginosus TaxID=429701 RepID=A0A2G9HN32_9LAMI|nr:hypothetical protein CDL12_08408 [Handroanthus impetiginosus]
MDPTHSVDIETPNEQKNTHPNSLPQICWKHQKVPQHMRREDRSRGAYDPKVVSFGPYHHGKPELQTYEEVKHLALQMLLQGSNNDQEFFEEKVLEFRSFVDISRCILDGESNPVQNLDTFDTLIFDDGEDKVSKFLQRAAWDTSDEEQHKHIKQQLEKSSPLHLLGALHEVLAWDDTPKSLQDQSTYFMTNKKLCENVKYY